jgi:hypothetical protein
MHTEQVSEKRKQLPDFLILPAVRPCSHVRSKGRQRNLKISCSGSSSTLRICEKIQQLNLKISYLIAFLNNRIYISTVFM